MSILKKTMKISGILLLVLIVLALIIPLIFKKQITTIVKKEINKTLLAKVDFTDVSLSLFKHFPNASITIDELSIISSDSGMFSNDTVMHAKQVDASANLISIIKGEEIKIHGFFFESPRINALVNKEGIANWDIVKPSETIETDTTASPFTMSLKKYSIHNG